MKNLINLKNNQGIALIATILLMSLILFLSLYFLNFSLTEKRIAHSQAWGAKTYYLAEAGIAEMAWRLKNNEIYKNNFETDPIWTQTFTRDDPFGVNSGSYTVTITNSSLAHGVISAVGAIGMGNGKTSQRIVKTYIYKALSQGIIDISDSAILSDQDTKISLSKVNIINGSMHANDDINIEGWGTIVNVDDDIRAVDKYSKSFWSTANVGGNIYDDHDYPPTPESIGIPPVAFDDPEDSNSLKNQADIIYSENEFKNLLNSAGSSLTLNNKITYVTGDIIFKGNPDIILNGLLVADGTITIGKVSWWWFIPYCPGNEKTSITVNHTEGQASGIFSKENINFEFCTSASNIQGVIYAAMKINITSFSNNINFTGGLIAGNIDITSIWQPINITLNNDIINDTLAVTEFSPIITVEHWEEEY